MFIKGRTFYGSLWNIKGSTFYAEKSIQNKLYRHTYIVIDAFFFLSLQEEGAER